MPTPDMRFLLTFPAPEYEHIISYVLNVQLFMEYEHIISYVLNVILLYITILLYYYITILLYYYI